MDFSALRNRRVLITGGLGFIGSNLALFCLEHGADVTIYDCLDPHGGGSMYNVREFEDNLTIILNDLRSFEGICACIRNKDYLFNCAAYTSHPNSMKEPLIDVDVNCKGVINLLEAARRFNPNVKIVHVGTSTQTGAMVYAPMDEAHPEFPLDIYSANKSVSEKYVLIYGHAYGMKTTVIRLANVFGPRSNIKSPEFGFMNYFIGLGLQNKEIPVFGEGAQRRNFSFVGDCVQAMALAALDERSNGEVFFATADHHHTVVEIAHLIETHVGGRVRLIDWPKDRKAIEIGDAEISNAKIRQQLGWCPHVDIPTGLAHTRTYFEPLLSHYL